ncbi:MAG TPA: hypothetical protein PK961_16090 [bacterium]|nr:hypothetical protein [bacterium]
MNEPLASQIPPFRNLRVQVEVITHCNVQCRICVRPHPASTWGPGRVHEIESRQAMWESKAYRAFRRALNTRRYETAPQMCQECVEYEVEE